MSTLQTTHHRLHRGYTLLFAVITSAVVLGVAVFIVTISKKQYALSVTARDSMYALYAADSAMECASVADLATTTGSNAPATVVLHCNNADSAGVAFGGPISNPDATTWPSGFGLYQAPDILVVLNDGTCAKVTITDGYYIDGTVTKHKTVVDSRGYNYCDGSGPKTSSRTVERALRLTYR